LLHEDVLKEIVFSRLPEAAHEINAHEDARNQIVQAVDRTSAMHLQDHATHECLRRAADQEDKSRFAMNEALKAARRERSAIEVCKADLQRAMAQKHRMLAQYRADDMRGTTFGGWNAEDMKNMNRRSRTLE